MIDPDIYTRVEEALASIGPFLTNDGSVVTLERINDDLTVTVRLHGACGSCPFSEMTMRNGIEEAIQKYAPEIKRVVAVE